MHGKGHFFRSVVAYWGFKLCHKLCAVSELKILAEQCQHHFRRATASNAWQRCGTSATATTSGGSSANNKPDKFSESHFARTGNNYVSVPTSTSSMAGKSQHRSSVVRVTNLSVSGFLIRLKHGAESCPQYNIFCQLLRHKPPRA